MKRRSHWMLLVALASLLVIAPHAQARVWTDRSGRTIDADFVRLDGANVIVSRQGKEISIPLEKLSDEDQQFAKTAKPGEATGGGGDNPFESEGNSNSGGSKPSDGGDSDNDRERSGKYPLRDWRDRVGNRSRARFVSVVGQDVVLEKNNGIRINVPFHTLIENDQEYVERELKKAGTAHLTPSRTPPQNNNNNNFGGGRALPPPGGYGPGMGAPGAAGPPIGGFGPPAGGFGSPPGGAPPGSSPPGFSSPPGGIGPGGGYAPSSPPGGFGSPAPGYKTPPIPGAGAESPGMESPPGGYSSPPSGAPPGGYSSPPSGAPPGGFGPPGGEASSPPMSTAPGGPPPGGYTPPGGYGGPPSSGPGYVPPAGGPPFGAPFGTPSGPGFNGPGYKEIFTCTNCNKTLPDHIKAGDRCPHCRAFLAYEQGADGKKTYAGGGKLATYFIFGGGGFTAIAVVIGIIIRVIISAVKD